MGRDEERGGGVVCHSGWNVLFWFLASAPAGSRGTAVLGVTGAPGEELYLGILALHIPEASHYSLDPLSTPHSNKN